MEKNWLERFCVVLLAFVGYTAMDILATPLFLIKYEPWFVTWQTGLATLCIVIGIAYRSIRLPIALLILSYNGAEDFFYYLLQMKLPPATLPWLTSPLVLQPATNFSTILGTIWGFGLLILFSSPFRINRKVADALD